MACAAVKPRPTPPVARLRDLPTRKKGAKTRARASSGIPATRFGLEKHDRDFGQTRSEEHTSELQSQSNLVCRLLLEKKKKYEKTAPKHTRTHCARLPPMLSVNVAV